MFDEKLILEVTKTHPRFRTDRIIFMIEKYDSCPIEYDETHKRWKVKLGGMEIDCDSERDAKLISNIPCQYETLLNYNSSQHDYYFLNSLQQTVDIINSYSIKCHMTRKIQERYKEISQESQPW
jgi:hypothetical protein